MGKRAALGLRVIAVVVALDVARMLALAVWRERLMAELRAGAESRTIIEQLAFYSTISFWAHVALGAAVIAGAVLLAVALRHGRALALGAAAAMLVHVGLSIAGRSMDWPEPIPITAKLLWWSSGVSMTLAAVLPLVAAHVAARLALTRMASIGAVTIAGVDAAVSAYSLAADVLDRWMMWTEYAILALLAAWLAGFAWPIGRRLLAEAEPALAARLGALDGTPLRALGWALMARIGLGVLLQVLVVIAMVNGEYQSVGGLTSLGSALGVIVSIAVAGAMIAYLRYPETHRSDALVVALGLLVAGVVLDIVAASAASELFGLVAEAKRASSFWAMPSLSKMEELQLTSTWAGRGGLAIGLAAGFALVSSLLATARAEGSAELVAKAQRVRTLLLVAGGGAIGVSFLMQALRGDAVFVLLVGALVLLGLAVFLLIDWIGLLFGLASAVERPRTETA